MAQGLCLLLLRLLLLLALVFFLQYLPAVAEMYKSLGESKNQIGFGMDQSGINLRQLSKRGGMDQTGFGMSVGIDHSSGGNLLTMYLSRGNTE